MKVIMIIDDSRTVRQSIALVLEDFGLQMKQAKNGIEALEEINTIKKNGDDVALCITDVNMPVMDGIAFVKEFRKSDKFTPVLMVTTEAGNPSIQEGKKAGASGWIVKPFKTDQFKETVHKFIN